MRSVSGWKPTHETPPVCATTEAVGFGSLSPSVARRINEPSAQPRAIRLPPFWIATAQMADLPAHDQSGLPSGPQPRAVRSAPPDTMSLSVAAILRTAEVWPTQSWAVPVATVQILSSLSPDPERSRSPRNARLVTAPL